MTTQTKTLVGTSAPSLILSALFAAALGVTLLLVAGHLQAATLHDAAHDVRHATGFPCH